MISLKAAAGKHKGARLPRVARLASGELEIVAERKTRIAGSWSARIAHEVYTERVNKRLKKIADPNDAGRGPPGGRIVRPGA